MTDDRFPNFMKGFFSASELMVRAGDRGCFVEYVCLAASVVDGFLRTGLVLRHQLDTKTAAIPDELIHQSDDDKILSERAIYKMALERGIITPAHFELLEALYAKRNKVIHRYIISEITTDQVAQIAGEYQQILQVIGQQVRQLEDQQLATGIGMTVSASKVPADKRASKEADIREMVDEKHGNPNLAKNLRKSSGTNGS